jgi:apolipoprotein N-acyltransferase
LLFSFVPFLIIENHIFDNPKNYALNDLFIYLLPGFVILNIIALGWVRAANITAAIIIIVGLSSLMTFVLWLAHVVRVRAGNIPGVIAFLSFWLAFEFLSLNTAYLSPWMNLGNGLAREIIFIQWYEYTGVAGGTLWILLSNLFLTLLLFNSGSKEYNGKMLFSIWVTILIIPSVISITRYYSISQERQTSSEIVIIQPNIDPFSEKYVIPFETQLQKVTGMAENIISENTEWMITPETTIDDPVNEEDMLNNRYLLLLKKFAGDHPGVNIVTGMVSYRNYPGTDDPPTRSARKTDNSGKWYDHFNSAFRIDAVNTPDIYRKSKLVAGIEREFSSVFGKLINKIVPEMGGTAWGYGTQKERVIFEHSLTGQKAGPVICYESVFGNYVADYVRKGAGALFIITNDGWWKNTNGYRQHLNYASLRAIETRRQVARSANTGISCIIDKRGTRVTETEWWEEAALKGDITFETSLTFYVRYGDYLMRFSALTAILLLLYVFFTLPFKRKIQ